MTDRNMILRKIANILYVNSQNIIKDNLLDGKLGVVLFFYHYSRYTSIENYTEFPDNFLDKISDKISIYSPKAFNSGICGIGWAINYLMKNKFVESEDGEDVLSEIDDFVSKMTQEECVKELDDAIPVFSKGIYFLQRGKPDCIAEALQLLPTVIEKRDELPLCYLNSVFYVVLSCLEQNIEREICCNILRLLNPYLKKTFDRKRYELGDLPYLFQHLQEVSEIEQVAPEYEGYLELCQRNMSDEVGDTICYLYHNLPDQNLDLDKIDEFIDENCKHLEEDQLTVWKGLAGIGLNQLA